MKQIAMLLYPGFTPLDAIGPYHALSQFPGYEFSFVALNAGPVSDGSATIMQAQKSISEVSLGKFISKRLHFVTRTGRSVDHRISCWNYSVIIQRLYEQSLNS
jgi:putative intracellular protease/amidase